MRHRRDTCGVIRAIMKWPPSVLTAAARWAKMITVTVMCTAPITRVTISGPTSAIARNPVTLTAMVLPVQANPPITYTWSPAPVSGNKAASRRFITGPMSDRTRCRFTATNCGGAITDGHAIAVIDNDPPTWTLEVPTIWVNSSRPKSCSMLTIRLRGWMSLPLSTRC